MAHAIARSGVLGDCDEELAISRGESLAALGEVVCGDRDVVARQLQADEKLVTKEWIKSGEHSLEAVLSQVSRISGRKIYVWSGIASDEWGVLNKPDLLTVGELLGTSCMCEIYAYGYIGDVLYVGDEVEGKVVLTLGAIVEARQEIRAHLGEDVFQACLSSLAHDELLKVLRQSESMDGDMLKGLLRVLTNIGLDREGHALNIR